MSEIISSRANPRVKQLRAALSGQARLAQGLIAIEGTNLLEAALETNQAIKTVFVAENAAEPGRLPRGIEVLRLAGDLFASVSDTQSPQGVAALLVPPVATFEQMLRPSPVARSPLIVVAVGLQDPGNLGTLIRSAVAFGATGLLTTPGTVSPWNAKALRASAGAVFHLAIAPMLLESGSVFADADLAVLAAVPGGAPQADAADLASGTALLIGNEGAGLPAEWLALATARVTIATPGPVESLNAAVAGSLLLYEASRQRRA